jgi:hypothetical protein
MIRRALVGRRRWRLRRPLLLLLLRLRSGGGKRDMRYEYWIVSIVLSQFRIELILHRNYNFWNALNY